MKLKLSRETINNIKTWKKSNVTTTIITHAGNFAEGNEFNYIRVENLIPTPFPNGQYLDENIAPAYSAYSPRNAKVFPFIPFPGRNSDNQKHVMFMNYGRIEDYEALFSENEGKESEIRSALSGDIVIVR